MANGYGLPFVESHYLALKGKCEHPQTHWRRWKREERLLCCRCGQMLPRTYGVRHVEDTRTSKAHEKRKAKFLAKRREEALKRLADRGREFAAAINRMGVSAEAALARMHVFAETLSYPSPRKPRRAPPPV